MCRHYDLLLHSYPLKESVWVHRLALWWLSAHQGWRRYFNRRPFFAVPLEQIARTVVDLASHLLRWLHDPLYAELRGDAILWSPIPARQPASWSAAVVGLASDAKILFGVCLVAALVRRLLRSQIDRRSAELQQAEQEGGQQGSTQAEPGHAPQEVAGSSRAPVHGAGSAGHDAEARGAPDVATEGAHRRAAGVAGAHAGDGHGHAGGVG